MTLRDALPDIAIEAGKTYRIYVGVWRARRGGERLKVVDAGGATIDADRILVATIRAP
jgi:glycine/D-amino acid oxidase-like deaminating enzyme